MHFSYLVPWPDQLSAEQEFGHRLVIAARNAGHDCTLLTEIQLMTIPQADRMELTGDFILLPHFTQAKVPGVPSVSLVWNSPFTVNKYSNGTLNLVSSDFLASGGSERADKHFGSFGGPKLISPLFPSAVDLSLESRVSSDSKPFYSGINWERVNGLQQRHSDILRLLDRADLVNIYGPKRINNQNVWEDFRTYRGEIPSDGVQVVLRANTCGISLGLLNEEHIDWGFAPMRISEAFAAKNVLITEDHQMLGGLEGLIYKIPSDLTQAGKAQFIGNAIHEIRSNPERSREMANQAARSWFEQYALETQVARLVDSFTKASKDTSLEIKSDDFISPHSGNYLFKLSLALENKTTKLIFHTRMSKKNRDHFESYFHNNPDKAYALGFVEITDKNAFRPMSALVQNDNSQGSYFAAEALVLNLKAITLKSSELYSADKSTFFENLLLGNYGAGMCLPIQCDSILTSYRFSLKVRHYSTFGLINPGEINGIGRVHPSVPFGVTFARTFLFPLYRSLPSATRNLLARFYKYLKR